jgi:hypothetical protein
MLEGGQHGKRSGPRSTASSSCRAAPQVEAAQIAARAQMNAARIEADGKDQSRAH